MIDATIADLATPMSRLFEDPDNKRLHSAESVEALVVAFREFGQLLPISVMPDGMIVAGNGTYRAAKRLGWTEIATLPFTLGLEAAHEFALADNRSAELSSWHQHILALQVMDIASQSPTLAAAMGWSDRERQAMARWLREDDVAPESSGDSTTDSGGTRDVTLVFATAQEHETWQAFASTLPARYPGYTATGDRVAAWIETMQAEGT